MDSPFSWNLFQVYTFLAEQSDWFIREITHDFNNFGPMLSISIVLDMSRELRVVKMSSLQHETSQSGDGKRVYEEKLNKHWLRRGGGG